jgi:radical SAM protein with 4Fe4S-binding SPASM domain
MGEPLTHPDFKQILALAQQKNMPIQLTTNGTLLTKYDYSVFFHSSIRQINFSLHSFKDNFPGRDWKPYLYDLMTFSRQALLEKPELYINYRLWNLPTSTEGRSENQDMMDEICGFFDVAINPRIDVAHRRSKNITGRLYFHFDTRFEWPSLSAPYLGEKGFCHALSQHIGIHANGTVVACCLDKEAGNNLGNVFETPFTELIQSPQLIAMAEGFKQGRLVSELCQKCSFISRFKNVPRSL